MKYNHFFAVAAILCGAMFASCANENVEPVQTEPVPATRAYGDKSPIIVAYIETNDTNPLNAGLYQLQPDGIPVFDVVNLFAANIHHGGENGVPAPANHVTLFLNDKLQPVIDDVAQYVAPLQAQGIKVLLTLLGDHKGVGVSNLCSNNNADRLARICAYVVETYGLDGIDIDDEYAKYGEDDNFPAPSAACLSNFILELRDHLGPDKLITLFEYGEPGNPWAYNLTTAAENAIDYAYYYRFGSNYYGSSSNGFPNAKWSPQAINLNASYSSQQLTQIQNRSSQAAGAGMGAIMTYNLRIHTQCDPLAAIDRIVKGAYGTSKSATRTTPPANGYPRANPGPGCTFWDNNGVITRHP